MRAGIDKYQRIRYQSRSGKGGRGSYKEHKEIKIRRKAEAKEKMTQPGHRYSFVINLFGNNLFSFHPLTPPHHS